MHVAEASPFDIGELRMKTFAKRALIVLAFGFAGFTGRHGGADDSPGIVLLRGSYRSTATVKRDYRTGEYVRASRDDEGERPTVSIRRADFPYAKTEPVYGPPMTAPERVEVLGQWRPPMNWGPVCLYDRHFRGFGGGMVIGGPLDGSILPGINGGMIIGGPLSGTILPGREGGVVIGGPLEGTLLPSGWR